MIRTLYCLHVKYRYYYQILMKLEFSRQTLEKFSYIKFHELHPEEAEFFHTERRIDVTKEIVAFRSFANAPERKVQAER